MGQTDIKGCRTLKFKSDIDIDFSDREQVLDLLNVTPAGIIKDNKLTRHNTGVYATDISSVIAGVKQRVMSVFTEKLLREARLDYLRQYCLNSGVC